MKTAYQPGTHVEINPGTSPHRRGTVDSGTTVYPCRLVVPVVTTYGNGIGLASANWGDSNTEEGLIEQVEIPPIHPQSNTAYDKSTAFATGDTVDLIQHIVNFSYWLPGSSLTTTINKTKLVPTANGLVKAMLAHTATPLPMHTWVARKTVSSASYTIGKYLGLVSSFTA